MGMPIIYVTMVSLLPIHSFVLFLFFVDVIDVLYSVTVTNATKTFQHLPACNADNAALLDAAVNFLTVEQKQNFATKVIFQVLKQCYASHSHPPFVLYSSLVIRHVRS